MIGSNPLIDAPHQPSKWSAFLEGHTNSASRCKPDSATNTNIPNLPQSRGQEISSRWRTTVPSWQQGAFTQHAAQQASHSEPPLSHCEQPCAQQQQHQPSRRPPPPWSPLGTSRCSAAGPSHAGSGWNTPPNRTTPVQPPQQQQHLVQQGRQQHGQQQAQQQHAGQHWQQTPAPASSSWPSSAAADSGRQQHQQLQRQGEMFTCTQDKDIELLDDDMFAVVCMTSNTTVPIRQEARLYQQQQLQQQQQQPHWQQQAGAAISMPGSVQRARHASRTTSAVWGRNEVTQQQSMQAAQHSCDTPLQQDRKAVLVQQEQTHQLWQQQQRQMQHQQAMTSAQNDCQEFAGLAGHQQCQQGQRQQQDQPQLSQQQQQQQKHQTPWQQQPQQQRAQQQQQQQAPWNSPPNNRQQQQQQQQQLSTARPNPAAASRWANNTSPTPILRVARSAARPTTGLGSSAAATRATAAVQSSQKGPAGDSKVAKGANKSKKPGGQLGSNIEREFVRWAPGSTTSELKMVQASIEATLQRARRKRQESQQQQQQLKSQEVLDGSSVDFGLLAGSGNSIGARKPAPATSGAATAAGKRDRAACAAADKMPAASKVAVRKRKSSTAAAAAAGEGVAAAAGDQQLETSGSGGASRKRKNSGKTAAQLAADQAVEEATETLDLHRLSTSSTANTSSRTGNETSLLDLSQASAWQQLQQQLPAADAVALGLLLCQRAGHAVQYYTSLQPLTKQQLQLLKKGARASKKVPAAAMSATAQAYDTAAAAAAAAGDAEEDSSRLPNDVDVVGLAFMPAAANSKSRATYYLHIPALKLQQQSDVTQQQQLPAPVHALLSQLLQPPGRKRPLVCSNAKLVLCCLAGLGLQLPPAADVALVDPELLAWLADPQLVQDAKQYSSRPADNCYSLQATLERYGSQAAISCDSAPLQRLHQQLQASISLADCLVQKLKGHIGDRAITTEMQVATVLAKMELVGVGMDPGHLLGHKAALQQRLAAITARAAELAGGPFNLASASQLSRVLYEVLKLPPPAGGGGRGVAKTHLPTDEAALKQLELSSGHELPGLAIEYRSKMNAMSKYFDAPWVQRALKQAHSTTAAAMLDSSSRSSGGGGGVPQSVVDLRCCWNQINTATGRLSSCAPNLQAVTKYSITSEEQQQRRQRAADQSSAAAASFSIRDVFLARPGYVLLSADYSQVELRLLAHFSGDQLLQQLLSQSGPKGDVFSLIAAAWQQPGGRLPAAGVQVDPVMRERAKRVTYGICYGVGAYRLSQQLQDQGITVEQAQALIDSFLGTFSGVQRYMETCLAKARAQGAVCTLLQRVRPVADLHSPNFQDRSAAERKVVNTILQGSAADIIKLAMCEWDAWAESAVARPLQAAGHTKAGAAGCGGGGACARLIGQIHDELLFEVAAGDCVYSGSGEVVQPGSTLLHVARVVKSIMQGAAQVDVGLHVQLSYGSRWGSMQALEI